MIGNILFDILKIGLGIIDYDMNSSLNQNAPLGSAFNTMLEKGMDCLDSMSLQGEDYGSGCDY